MVLTKEYLAYYPYLRMVIARDEKKLQRYENNPPVVLYGKVYGSNPCFPYELRGFTVCGPSSTSDSGEWERRVKDLRIQIDNEKKFFEQLMVEVDELIASIKNPRDKLVFEYIYHEGMKQKDVAKKLHIDQSMVSKTIDKYVE